LTDHKAHRLLALFAAAGLLVLTIATLIRPSDQIWPVVTIVLAWVAILSLALVARDPQEGAIVSLAGPSRGTPPPFPPAADAARPRAGASESVPGGLAVVQFAQELLGTMESDRLHHLIARRLPSFVGRKEVWAVARFGTRQHVIVPPGTDGAPPVLLTADVRQWVTFPMKVKGQPVGIIGVGVQAGALSENEHRILLTLAGLVGQSLAAANTFETMREASLVDPMTGCATRAEGLRRFEAELRRSERTRSSLAVALLDLDHFKSINDRFGHNTGDAVLSALGQMLLKTLRASDIRCRWGGEEFLLLLTDSSDERARRACETLRQRIEVTPVRASGHTVQMTASIGVTVAQPGAADIQRLLAQADAALYHAKSQGRNRVEFMPRDPDAGADGPSAVPGAPSPARPVSVEPVGRWPDRRDPSRADRRRVPSPGRRRTDPGLAADQWPA
jgi:diguanylate cyclase (GGDEF)-like protein